MDPDTALDVFRDSILPRLWKLPLSSLEEIEHYVDATVKEGVPRNLNVREMKRELESLFEDMSRQGTSSNPNDDALRWSESLEEIANSLCRWLERIWNSCYAYGCISPPSSCISALTATL